MISSDDNKKNLPANKVDASTTVDLKDDTAIQNLKLSRSLALIDDLLALPSETSWVEFKDSNSNPVTMGVRISALANAARIADQHNAYMLWGVRDSDHAVVGTTFNSSTLRHQGEPLEFWLAKRLNPSIPFRFQALNHAQGHVVLLEIPAATSMPIEFDRFSYIRIDSATPRLSDFPERMRELWAKLQPYAWESGLAAQYILSDKVLSLIDYTSYFDLTKQPLPDNRSGIFEKLEHDKIITKDVGGRWNITNLGAILFAKRLDGFDSSISRKAIRFVAYDGSSRSDKVVRRYEESRGYAAGFNVITAYIRDALPSNEHIGIAFRSDQPMYPGIAIREMVANALLHQDMTITGAGPLVELFNDRMEITNPGKPLIKPERFIDLPPRSRNEALASLARRMNICEEEGTGVDKTIRAVELFQLPPPDFRVAGDSMRVTLYAHRTFSDMTPDERIRACHQHAILCFVSGNRMKNATLRERFGIEPRNASQVSQVIKQALRQGLIRPADPDRPQAAYVPTFA